MSRIGNHAYPKRLTNIRGKSIPVKFLNDAASFDHPRIGRITAFDSCSASRRFDYDAFLYTNNVTCSSGLGLRQGRMDSWHVPHRDVRVEIVPCRLCHSSSDQLITDCLTHAVSHERTHARTHQPIHTPLCVSQHRLYALTTRVSLCI